MCALSNSERHFIMTVKQLLGHQQGRKWSTRRGKETSWRCPIHSIQFYPWLDIEYRRKGWGINNTMFLVQETKANSTINRKWGIKNEQVSLCFDLKESLNWWLKTKLTLHSVLFVGIRDSSRRPHSWLNLLRHSPEEAAIEGKPSKQAGIQELRRAVGAFCLFVDDSRTRMGLRLQGARKAVAENIMRFKLTTRNSE